MRREPAPRIQTVPQQAAALRRFGRPAALALAAVALVLAASQAWLPQDGFWITDNAGKFLQLQAFLAGDGLDTALEWAGRPFDPELAWNPLPPPFSSVVEGRIYSQYPPAFAVLSAPLFRLFGFAGLRVLPLLATVLLLAALCGVAAELGLDSRLQALLVLVAGLCTPLWFYALVFWEHAIVGCLAMVALWAFLVAVRSASLRAAAACGLAIAMAVWFREEMLLLAAVLGGLLVAGAASRRLALGLAFTVTVTTGLLPLLVFQWAATGTPLGHHVGANLGGLEGHLAMRAGVIYRLLLAAGPEVGASIALSAPFLLALLWRPRLSTRVATVAVPLLALYAAGYGLVVVTPFWTSGAPILHLLQSNSLFAACPLLLLGLVRLDPPLDHATEAATRRVWVAVVGYALAYALVAPVISTQGIHWGNRYLLVLYPPLALLAVRNLALWRSGGALRAAGLLAVALALAVSFAAQLESLRLLERKRTFSSRLARAVAQRAEPALISDVWWAPPEMYPAFDSKPMFLVRDAEQLDVLRRRLADAGLASALLVTRHAGPNGPHDPNGGERVVIDDGGLGFFSLDLVPIILAPPLPPLSSPPAP